MSVDREALLKRAWGPVEAGEMEAGTRVMIHRVDRGTMAEMRRVATRLAVHLRDDVKRKYPLECWVIGYRKLDDPLGAYGIFAEFWGTVPCVQERGRWHARRRKQRRVSRTT